MAKKPSTEYGDFIQKIAIDEQAWTVTVHYGLLEKSLTHEMPGKTVLAKADEATKGLFLNGVSQRVGDAKAGDKTGRDKYAYVQKIFTAWAAGEYEVERADRDTSEIVIAAVARESGNAIPDVQAVLASLKSDEERTEKLATWRADVRIRAMIAKIRAERLEAAADSTDEFKL